jgi:hypothetical protein
MTAAEFAVVIHRRASGQTTIVDLLALISFLALLELFQGKFRIELENAH